VDGFVAGIWRQEGEVLTIEPFGKLSKAQGDEVVQEAERMLTVMAGSSSYDIRFGALSR
jgi:hypothetical protein